MPLKKELHYYPSRKTQTNNFHKKMNFYLDTQKTLQALLNQEDTDNDKKITIDDKGPKCFYLKNQIGENFAINGTYQLSNLLQELAFALQKGDEMTTIPYKYINEKPVERISRKIKTLFWDGLTRTIDQKGLHKILEDQKTASEFSYLYVPIKDDFAFKYYKNLEKTIPNLKVVGLPDVISDEFSLTLNKQPGILALALQKNGSEISGVPFVVPGGRFNEMYGWDSYFIAIGLLIDDKIDLAIATAENFKYQIDHYGKILNANRSYYLSRTQPPFYTTLLVAILAKQKQEKEWVAKHLKTAIHEYQTVWNQKGKRLTTNGLNRYKAEGIGIPYEVESGHFDDILQQYADKYKMDIREFETQYLERQIIDDELDDYFIHDRSMRESGHDTTNRLVGICANLNPIALNSLLYKYETDIAFLIETQFDNHFQFDKNTIYTKEYWSKIAENRKNNINKFCWNETDGIYYDYNFVTKETHFFEAATTFYPLWAKICNDKQAEILVKKTLPKFKMKGGIAGSTQQTFENLDKNAPIRQWDYPFGWAPHQIMLWQGLINYNYTAEAQEMVYRWLWLITKNAVDYNGTIPEKYDLEISSHKIFAEYGNVGTEFNYITQEGFGWMNASYQFGLTILTTELIDNLNNLIDPEKIFH
jgi:alpha,alpha-trehalase